MRGSNPKIEDFRHKTWDLLFQEALNTAQFHVNRLSWRGTKGGVLPHGYDPNSIAAEAILDLIKNHPWEGVTLPSDLSKQLRRRVWRHVDRLHHRKENFVTLNDPDLAPICLDDGDRFSIIELIAAPNVTPLEHLIRKEEQAQFEQLQARVQTHLGRHHRLKRLFSLICDGISKPHDLARRLKVRLSAIPALKNRLRRHLIPFFSGKTSARKIS
jgi:hypothetical protein